MAKKYWENRLLKRAFVAISVTLSIYAFCGFFLPSWLGRDILVEHLEAMTGRKVELAQVKFNPFTGRLRLLEFNLGQADSRSDLSFLAIDVNVCMTCLPLAELRLEQALLDQAQVGVYIDQQGLSNWQKISTQLNEYLRLNYPPDESPADPTEGEESPMSWRIDDFQVIAAQLSFSDHNRSEAFSTHLSNIDFKLQHLANYAFELGSGSDSDASSSLGAYDLRIAGSDLGSLRSQGALSVTKEAVNGHFAIGQLSLSALGRYGQEHLNYTLADGQLSSSFDFSIAPRSDDSIDLRLSAGALNLASLQFNTLQGEKFLSLETLQFSQVGLDLSAQKLALGQISARGFYLDSRLDEQGINWLPLLLAQAEPAKTDPAASAATETEASTSAEQAKAVEPSEETVSWEVSGQSLVFDDFDLPFTDERQSPALAWRIKPLKLTLGAFTYPQQESWDMSLEADVVDGAHLAVDAQIMLEQAVDFTYDLKALDLSRMQTYLQDFVALNLSEGRLSSKGAGRIHALDQAQAQLNLQARVNVQALKSSDTKEHLAFVSWDDFQLEGLDIDSQEKYLSIEEILLNKPFARLVLFKDGGSNIAQILTPQKATASSAKGTAKVDSSEKQDWLIEVKKVRVVEGDLDFTDMFFERPFKTVVADLEGQVTGLSSQQGSLAKLQLDGRVDNYAPVKIAGRLNPLTESKTLDMSVDFDRMKLSALTPYSGKFAGYKIERGTVSLDLNYHLDGDKLRGDNKILVDQLELGERVDSPDATTLPVSLAVALLKDTQGRINIDLPVSGDVSNPEFSIGGQVFKVFTQLITKIITSPFRALGALFGDGVDIDDKLWFEPGDAQLSVAAQGNLDNLAGALAQRPELRLEIQGRSSTRVDWPELAQLKLNVQLVRLGIAEGLVSELKDSSQTQVLSEAAELELQGLLYKQGHPELKQEQWPTPAQIRAELIAGIDLDEGALMALAATRAAEIQTYLLSQQGVAEARLQLGPSSLEAPLKDFSVEADEAFGQERDLEPAESTRVIQKPAALLILVQ